MTPLPCEIPPTGAPARLALALQAAVPVLETARTRLRALQIEDFSAWAEILCSDRAAYMDGPYERDDAFMEFAASAGGWLLRGHGAWTIEERATGAVLGFVLVGLETTDREPELGFFLREGAEGQGLGFEAATAARDWAWAQGLASLVSYVDPANDRSAALATRLGAARDAAAESEFDGTPEAGIAVFRHPRPREAAR